MLYAAIIIKVVKMVGKKNSSLGLYDFFLKSFGVQISNFTGTYFEMGSHFNTPNNS